MANSPGAPVSGVQGVTLACAGAVRTAAAYFDYAPRGLEGVRTLFARLRERGWRCLFLVDERYPGELRLDGEIVHRVSRDALEQLECVDVFFVLDDACYRYPQGSTVVAMYHSLDLEMATREVEVGFADYCKPLLFADYLLTPYAGIRRLGKDRVRRLFEDLYPTEMVLRDGPYTILPGGYLNVEALKERVDPLVPDALLYAPTAGHVGNAGQDDRKVLELLVSNFPETPVIFRPHPKDVDLPGNLSIVEEYKDNPLFEYDREDTNRRSLGRARVLITDTSGIGLTFAAALYRPVVFASMEGGAPEPEAMPFGFYSKGEQSLVEAVRAALESGNQGESQAVATGIKEILVNANDACTCLADNIETLLKKETKPEWIALRRASASFCPKSPDDVAEHVCRTMGRAVGSAQGLKTVCRLFLEKYLSAQEPESWDFFRHCHACGVNVAALDHVVTFYVRKFFGDPKLALLNWTFRQIFSAKGGYLWQGGELKLIEKQEEVALFNGQGDPFAIIGAGDAYLEYYSGPLRLLSPLNCVGFVDTAALESGRTTVDGYPVHAESELPRLGCDRFFVADYGQKDVLDRLVTRLGQRAE